MQVQLKNGIPVVVLDPTPTYRKEFDDRAQRVEKKYQDACSYYGVLFKDVTYPDIEDALFESDATYRNSIQKAARLDDKAEVGRLVMACVEAYLWDLACKKAGLETVSRVEK